MNAFSTMESKEKKALSRSLSTRRHRSLVISDRFYDVIIDQFIRVRMRQQSVRTFLRSVGIESAHESARGLDVFLK